MARYQWGEDIVGVTESIAVTVFQVDLTAQFGTDAVEVSRVDGQPVFVFLARGRDDADRQVFHSCFTWSAYP